MPTPKRTILTQPDDAVSADPQTATEPTASAIVDFDALPDPVAIDAAAEHARYAADHRESLAFLSRIVEEQHVPVQVALYRKMSADPRVPQLAALLRKINRDRFASWCNAHLEKLREAITAVDRTQGWARQADQAEQATAALPRLTGKECARLPGWKENGYWSPTVQTLSRQLLNVSATATELERQLVAAEEALGNAVQLYAGAVARHAGMPLVEVREPIRNEPLKTELKFSAWTGKPE